MKIRLFHYNKYHWNWCTWGSKYLKYMNTYFFKTINTLTSGVVTIDMSLISSTLCMVCMTLCILLLKSTNPMLNTPQEIPPLRIYVQWTIDCVKFMQKVNYMVLRCIFITLLYNPCHYIVLVNGISINCMNNNGWKGIV